MKAYRVLAVIAAAALLASGKAMAGGAYGVSWDNDGSSQGNNTGYIYTSAAGTTLLPNGDLIQLVAVQGNTNYVLASSTIGSVAANLSALGDPMNGGDFNLTSTINSNVLQGAIGSPLGVAVYNAATAGAATSEITIVPNGGYAASGPSPDWTSPPLSPLGLELDASTAPVPTITVNEGLGGFVAAGSVDGEGAFYLQAVPEPSSIALVVMGLFGAVGLIRRRRS